MVNNRLIIEDTEILIEHQSLTNIESYRNKDIYLESTSYQNNTLSTITFNNHLIIHVFCEFHACAKLVEILYVLETEVLFLGCDKISAQVDVSNNCLINANSIDLFWGLERHKQFILETGELQCFLYDLSGKLISSTSVDPPYEMEMNQDGIKFTSIVLGTTWLKYGDRSS